MNNQTYEGNENLKGDKSCQKKKHQKQNQKLHLM